MTDTEIELAQLRGALEEYRAYLAGPCNDPAEGPTAPKCPKGPYNGHRHYTEEYEDNRSTIIALNHLLNGDYSWPVTLRQIRETIG